MKQLASMFFLEVKGLTLVSFTKNKIQSREQRSAIGEFGGLTFQINKFPGGANAKEKVFQKKQTQIDVG